MSERLWSVARLGFAAASLLAVATQLADIVDRDLPVSNFLSYFTIQSNLLGAAVLVAVAVRVLAGRDVERLAMLRGASTLYLLVTGIVYFLLLRNVDVQTSEPWINTVLHYVMPVAMLVDWVAFPPRRVPAGRRALVWLLYPVAYVVYSLGRGAITDWYPYPFLDPATHGYAGVLGTGVGMLVAGAALSWLLLVLARTRHGGRSWRAPAAVG